MRVSIGLATVQVLYSHMWLVAPAFDGSRQRVDEATIFFFICPLGSLDSPHGLKFPGLTEGKKPNRIFYLI